MREFMAAIVEKIQNWEAQHATQLGRLGDHVVDGFWIFVHIMERIFGFLVRLTVMAIILNAIASSFWPELPDKMPVIYGFCNGGLQAIEYCYRLTFGFLGKLFSGDFEALREHFTQAGPEMTRLLGQVVDWMASLHF